ncbi:TonB-dependent receptor [Novosphingobium sp. Fuku2-ISO-50]|uniref:TonB-dependent receptor n=1 Tax=Novosphingobium sp. Fuku2-ISO-50 TaxID=1739114 RepID=UPI00076D2EFC|nr:TonB-dependent receptor [Novosphingobium sp. Fuku2-ISO-50]KUR77532.1 TonB-dependent receptor [Novosphingobium sp. Fuku2-ISO-50]
MIKQKDVLCSVAAGAIVLAAGPAWAQNATSTTASTAAPATPGATPEASGSGIQDIVVTAQRRTESLQKAALAVSVLGSDALKQAGVTQAQDLTNLVPALTLSSTGGGGTQVTIRGVGNFAGNPYAEPAVAVNLDGVYLARSSGPTGLYYDLDRVEVLKGPQGTLYGRNATAGAVNVIARRPQNGYEAEGEVEYGNYNNRRVELALNAPIEGVGAIRISGVVAKRDGYESDGYDDEDTQAVRGQLLVDHGGPFSLLVVGDYAHTGGMGSGGVFALSETGFVSSNPYLGAAVDGSNAILQGASLGITHGATANLLPPFKTDGFIDVNNWGISATAKYDFGGAELTVIPAYRNSVSHYLHYDAGFPVNSDEYSKATSVEARLGSKNKAAALQWLIGAYFFNEDLNFDLVPYQGVAYGPTQPILNTRSLAAFGQATYALTSALRLTGGLRYTNERKTQNGQLGYGPGPGLPVTYVSLDGGLIQESRVNWKAGVEFDAGPHSLLYANAATGFKAGGFYASALNPTAPDPATSNTSLPETITAFTAGAKNRFFGNTLQLNVEGFYWKYKDQQITHIGPVYPAAAGNNLITENAGSADIYGAEADLVWQPISTDRFAADVQYLHAKYNSFVYYQANVAGPGSSPQTACAYTTNAADTQFTVNCSGRVMPRSPKWTVNLSYQHTFELGHVGTLDARVGTRIESESVLGIEYLPGEYQKAYTKTNASLTWHDANKRYSITGYVDNIEKSVVKTYAFVQPVVGIPMVGLDAPRTYGVRLTGKF